MRFAKVLIIKLFMLCALANAGAFNGFVIYDNDVKKPLFGLGKQFMGDNAVSYYETGMLVQFPFRNNPAEWYGLYGGMYFNLLPIFRPGIITGYGIERKSNHQEYKSALSVNATVQIGMLTVIAGSHGFGGGINVQF